MATTVDEKPTGLTVQGDKGIPNAYAEGHIETTNALRTVDMGIAESEVVTEIPKAEQDRILRKVDMRVMPLLTFLYLIAFVDRSNSMSDFASTVTPPLQSCPF